MTTSGFLSSPGGRMTVAIIDTPPAAGMRTTCSRVWAAGFARNDERQQGSEYP